MLPLAAAALAGIFPARAGSSAESLAGELSLGGVVEADGMSGAASGRSWWGCSAPTQTNNQMSAKKEHPCAPNSGKRTIYLRWGLLWRIVAGSGKVVSDASSAVAVGSSSTIITSGRAGTLALFASSRRT